MIIYVLIFAACLVLVFVLSRVYVSRVNLAVIKKEYQRLLDENQRLLESLNKEIENRFRAQQNEALANQKYDAVLEQMKAFEEHKKQAMENAKAAIFDLGTKISSQLIDEHKKETLAAKEEAHKQFKQTSENLYKDFTNLSHMVVGLKDQVIAAQNNTDMVYQALLAPNTAGGLAEITLENILKSSNLIPDTDYQMQYSIMDQENNRLRPDAVVFLPGNNILVIDSKASKFFLEISKNKEQEIELKEKLKISMRSHLKSLSSKDYRQGMVSHLKDKKVKHISTLMFLPTESSVEQLQNIDPLFIPDAWQNNIFPVGPMGLVNILSHAKFQISEELKNENYHVIINEVSNLLYNVSNLTGHAKKLGSSLYSSMGYFDKFAASFNSNILSKSKKIEKLGVTVKSNKQIPESLDRYQVIQGSKFTLIENEENQNEEEGGE